MSKITPSNGKGIIHKTKGIITEKLQNVLKERELAKQVKVLQDSLQITQNLLNQKTHEYVDLDAKLAEANIQLTLSNKKNEELEQHKLSLTTNLNIFQDNINKLNKENEMLSQANLTIQKELQRLNKYIQEKTSTFDSNNLEMTKLSAEAIEQKKMIEDLSQKDKDNQLKIQTLTIDLKKAEQQIKDSNNRTGFLHT